MGLLRGPAGDGRRLMAAMLLVFMFAAFLRFYNIGWSFSNNGVDEGIMLMRARMVSEGYELYSEVPCDQAPLAFFLSAALDGDVLASRLLSAVLSIAAIAACMEAAKRTRGEVAMLATGLVLAVDFAFLRESRLFSLDGMSSYFLAFSLLPLLAYARGGHRPMLVIAGVLLGLSAASKLYGAVAVAGVLVFMLLETLAQRNAGGSAARKAIDAATFLGASVAPMAILLAALGQSEMLRGMVLDQGHRQLDLLMKLSVPLYFAFNLAYVLPFAYARAHWTRSPETRLLLCLSSVLLLNFVLQPLAFLHNMVLLSPPLAVLVGVLVADGLELEKGKISNNIKPVGTRIGMPRLSVVTALFVAGVVVSAGVASYGLAVQGKSPQEVYGEKIASWTSEGEWIISGDPLIAAYAERNVPPTMINMGTRIYPDITLQDVEDAVEEYDVRVVVVCYRLFEEDMAGLTDFLNDSGFRSVSPEVLGPWSEAAVDTSANSQQPVVYASHDIIDRFGLPISVRSAG